MPSLIDSITSFVGSIFNAIISVFTGALAIVQSFFNAILLAFSTFFNAIGASVRELASTFEGLTKFILSKSYHFPVIKMRTEALEYQSINTLNLGNIVVLGALAAAFVGYTVYTARQGRPVTAGNKKIN